MGEWGLFLAVFWSLAAASGLRVRQGFEAAIRSSGCGWRGPSGARLLPLGWLPGDAALLVAALPFSVAAEGLSSIAPSGRPPHAAAFIPWDRVRNLSTRRGILLIDGHAFSAAPDGDTLAELDRLAMALRHDPGPGREAIVDRWLSARFHGDRLRRRSRSLRGRTSTLALAERALAAVALAISIWFAGGFGAHLRGDALILAIALVRPALTATLAVVALTFLAGVVASRSLPAGLRPPRPASLFANAVFLPPALLRLRASITAARVHPFDPAAAAVLLPRRRRSSLWIAMLRDLRHPAPPPPGTPDEALAATAAHRRTALREISRLASADGLDLASLDSPPTSEPGAIAWCPRCRSQFTRPGTCPDGVPLIRFTGR